MVHPVDREAIQAQLRESVEKTHIWDREFRFMARTAGVHWLLAKGTVYVDESGQPIGMAGVSVDITERKEAEAALRKAKSVFAGVRRMSAGRCPGGPGLSLPEGEQRAMPHGRVHANGTDANVVRRHYLSGGHGYEPGTCRTDVPAGDSALLAAKAVREEGRRHHLDQPDRVGDPRSGGPAIIRPGHDRRHHRKQARPGGSLARQKLESLGCWQAASRTTSTICWAASWRKRNWHRRIWRRVLLRAKSCSES